MAMRVAVEVGGATASTQSGWTHVGHAGVLQGGYLGFVAKPLIRGLDAAHLIGNRAGWASNNRAGRCALRDALDQSRVGSFDPLPQRLATVMTKPLTATTQSKLQRSARGVSCLSKTPANSPARCPRRLRDRWRHGRPHRAPTDRFTTCPVSGEDTARSTDQAFDCIEEDADNRALCRHHADVARTGTRKVSAVPSGSALSATA